MPVQPRPFRRESRVELEGVARTLPADVGNEALSPERSHCMKRLLMLGFGVGACSQASSPGVALRAGMSEQQVIEVSGNRPPDRVVERTCGTETAAPFD